MGVGTYTLPICDGCRKPWLPDGWEPGMDPRLYDAEKKQTGGKQLRCGKCKTSGWDREHSSEMRKSPTAAKNQDLEKLAVSNEMVSEKRGEIVPGITHQQNARCKHMLLKCPICHKPEEQ